jgi:hypothetical protein
MGAFDSIAQKKQAEELAKKKSLEIEKKRDRAYQQWVNKIQSLSSSHKKIILDVLNELGIALFGKNSFFGKPKYEISSTDGYLLEGAQSKYPFVQVLLQIDPLDEETKGMWEMLFSDQLSDKDPSDAFTASYNISVQQRDRNNGLVFLNSSFEECDPDYALGDPIDVSDDNYLVSEAIDVVEFSRETLEKTVADLLEQPIIPFNRDAEVSKIIDFYRNRESRLPV